MTNNILRSCTAAAARRLVLAGTFAALLVSTDFVGSITHGSDHPTSPAPEPLGGRLTAKREPASPNKTGKATNVSAFASTVLPIFKKNCVNCHGPEKAKGGLRLDSLEAIKKGGENGPVMKPRKASASPLIRRLLLPIEHDEHMPPEGKPQPTPDEIALLRHWIDAGAHDNQ